MEIKVAKTAGFCFGVKRAVDMVYEQTETGILPIYTYGPIIHNEEVVSDLEKRGVRVIESEEDLEGLTGGTVIIRSHGVGKAIYDKLKKQGLSIVDATCPFVLKIHKIVEKASAKGQTVLIAGNGKHPEVEGIMGWCQSPCYVLETPEDAENLSLPAGIQVTVVSQTTFHYKKFQDIVEKILKKGYDSSVVNTICNATQERQVEARQIASEVDAMIVIGGKHSSNTQKLYEICSRECRRTCYIQTFRDLTDADVAGAKRIGITAGASTPKKIIEEVQTKCQN